MQFKNISNAARAMSAGGRTVLLVEIDEMARDYVRIHAALPSEAKVIADTLAMQGHVIATPTEMSDEDQAFMNSLGADPDEAGTLERMFKAIALACREDTGLGITVSLFRNDFQVGMSYGDPDAGTARSSARRQAERIKA